MEQFFGIPVARIGLSLGLALAAIVAAIAFLGSRRVPLAKLGARNVPRRPLRAALIVVGLTLSTTVIGSAFGTGDTITSTLRSLVTATLGTTDEAVVLNPPRQSNADRARALANGTFGGLKAGDLGFFSQREFDRLRDATGANPAIAALAPAIADQVTVVLGEEQQTRTAIGLLATRTPDAAFGTLRSTAGAALALEALAPDEVVLNSAAASALGAAPGQALLIRTEASRGDWTARIAAISPDEGIVGAAPLIVVPLETYQRVLGRAGQVNQILVANRGGRSSVTRTAAATQALRVALAEHGAARTLRDYLARPESQRNLLDAAAQLRDRDQRDLLALRQEAARPELTDRFISLATDPRIRRQLFFLASQLPNGTDRRAVTGALRGLTVLSVVEVKQEGLDLADEYGSVVTTVFLVLGIFSLGAAFLLIHLIFALLAADRSAELATMRSLGMNRRQITAIFLAEGLIYALLGAAFGALAAIVATRLTVSSLAGALVSFGYRLEPRVEPRSILIAFAGGALLTFLAMVVAAWRVSHAQIVAATRGEERSEGRWGGTAAGLALFVAAWGVWRHWQEPPLPYLSRPPLVAPGALSLLLLGLALVGLAALRLTTHAGGERGREAIQSGLGLALAAIWLRVLLGSPERSGDLRADAVAVAVAGLLLIGSSVWTATRLLGPLLKGLDRALSSLARLRLIVRPAAGYLNAGRWRTGLTVTMFGMVVFIMVASLAMIETLVNAYAGREAPVAGFDLRADFPLNAGGVPPIVSMDSALADTPAIGRAAFGGIGGTVELDAQIVQLGIPRAAWRNASIVAADDGFLGTIATGFERRAAGYASDAAVWRAVREQPGLAMIAGSSATTFATLPAGTGSFAPFTIWARPADAGRPLKLTVIGIIDPRADVAPGLWVSRATATGLGVVVPAPTSFYFALAPGTSAPDALAGLRVAFADRSIVVGDLAGTVRIGRSIRALLTQVVQGFMGLGLVAGVAALGIIGLQSVLERRQQLGTLRAIGYTRGQTRATLAFESAVVAALGIGLGTGLGLLLARSLVGLLATRNPEIRYAVPWDQIAVTLALAWAGSLGAMLLAAWQAGRVSPADALRAV